MAPNMYTASRTCKPAILLISFSFSFDREPIHTSYNRHSISQCLIWFCPIFSLN